MNDDEVLFIPPAPDAGLILRHSFPRAKGALPWKPGEYTPRALYDLHGNVLGLFDSAELCELICTVVNALPQSED